MSSDTRSRPRAARWICALALAGAGCAGAGAWTPPALPHAVWPPFFEPRAEPLPVLEAVPTADLTPPDPLRATSGEIQSIPLRWEPLLLPGVAGYLVERGRGAEGPFERIALLPGRERSCFVDGLDAAPERRAAALPDGASAFYRVSAFTRDGRLSAPSKIAQATTASLPEPPAELRAVSLQPRSVPLSWEASRDPHVTGYALYRSPTAAGPFELLAIVEGRHHTEYVDHKLGDLRVFYYQVAARRTQASEGVASESVRAVTKPEPLPPIGLRLAEQTLGANLLRWEANVEPDVARYRLLRRRPGEREFRALGAVDAGRTSERDLALAADERVVYAVSAVDASGLESAPSEPLEVAAAGYELSGGGGEGGVWLRWNPRLEEGFREAQILRESGFGARLIGTSRDGSYLDREVRRGSRYRYQVVLLRADGSRAPASSPLEVSLPAAPLATLVSP